MCGDLDDEESSSASTDRLREEFAAYARDLLSGNTRARASDARHAYMDRLFADALERCLKDVEMREAAVISDQVVVFARLCGLLAGHAPLQDDPLRMVLDALMAGYGEAQERGAAGETGHDHPHGHDHSH